MSSLINNPLSVFVYNNQVLFADSDNHRIRKILPNGSTITIAGTGDRGHNGDNRPATRAKLDWPCCVFVSERGQVYIGERCRVRKILTNGKIVTIAGTGDAGYNGDHVLATDAQIQTPLGIFVSANDEVYIADYGNHRIRKVLKNGMIITIAGTGVEGYSGDNVLATKSELNGPSSVFVSNSNEVFISERNGHRIRKIDAKGIITTIAGNGRHGYSGDNMACQARIYNPRHVFVVNDEVFIADYNNDRIRKVLKNGTIVTIAGTGIKGYNGDGILAINAQLHCPSSIFVSNSNEVFISEYSGHRIRKIDSNGIITTIAGNGQHGYSGDVEYNYTEHGIIGGLVSNNLPEVKIMKHERDCLYSSSVIGFLPMIELISPQFTKNVLNENFISKLDSKEQELVQQLIDNTLYDPENTIEYGTIEEILRVLFILHNTYGEFIDLKKDLVTSFVEKLNVNNVLDSLTTIEKYLDRVLDVEENNTLSKLKGFCFNYIAKSMHQQNCVLVDDERLLKYSLFIFRALGTMSLKRTLIIDEKPLQQYSKLDHLYNDKKTSDVKIKMKDSFIFCHKTILSSTSQLFKSMFESSSSFSDLVKDTDGIDVFTPECDEEVLIYVIKCCYGMKQEVNPKHVIPLVEMAHLHEIEKLIEHNISVTFDNFFEIAQCLKHELNSEIMATIVSNLINFGVSNFKELFKDEHDVRKIPVDLLIRIVTKMAQLPAK